MNFLRAMLARGGVEFTQGQTLATANKSEKHMAQTFVEEVEVVPSLEEAMDWYEEEEEEEDDDQEYELEECQLEEDDGIDSMITAVKPQYPIALQLKTAIAKSMISGGNVPGLVECDWSPFNVLHPTQTVGGNRTKSAAANTDYPPTMASPSMVIPHWWGYEDADHVAILNARYAKMCGIQPPSTQPTLGNYTATFVSKVIRTPVVPPSGCLDFCSLDHIFVSYHDFVAHGLPLSPAREFWVVSTWDVPSGLALRHTFVPTYLVSSVWEPRSMPQHNVALYCEPDAAHASTFIFSSARPCDRNLDTPTGYHNVRFTPNRTMLADCLTWSRIMTKRRRLRMHK